MSGNGLETADRLEIIELMARYCHRVDHGDADGWAALFTEDGIFEVEGAMRFAGPDQLRAMPAIVTEHGKGKWRHQVTCIAIDPGNEPGRAEIQAYGLVTDWNEGGKPSSFTDYAISLRRVGGAWRIAHLRARLV